MYLVQWSSHFIDQGYFCTTSTPAQEDICSYDAAIPILVRLETVSSATM